jgi:glycosyltransferase involved in cell wall biosynthesis
VCLAGVDWWHDSPAHSEVQLMRRLARDRPVLFVNSIGLRVPALGRSPRSGRRIVRKVRNTLRLLRTPDPALPGFSVLSPVVLPFYGEGPGRRARDGFLRWQVALACRLRGITDPVVVVTMPTAWDVARRLPRRRLVVNKADKYSTLPDVDHDAVAACEQALLERADTVLYVNRALMDEDAPRVGGRAVFLDHGVDTGHFRRRPPDEWPDDIAAIPGPRLGYFGRLDDYKTDLGLLEHVARSLPDASLVLVGDTTCDLGALTALPNVHWLGVRPYDDIPAYGSAFTVALMPYLDNDWVRHINPIKLKEYLALGLPVVSTPVPGAERWARHLRVAADRNGFVAEVRAALAEGDGDADGRRAAVAADSWDAKAQLVLDLVTGTGNGAEGGSGSRPEGRAGDRVDDRRAGRLMGAS